MNNRLYERFDVPVDRVNTECIKWDLREKLGNKDALPMWVADMDFRTADGILDAMRARVEHGIFGYPMECAADERAVINWMKTRHGCDVQEEWILYSPGVVDSMYHIMNAVASADARVVIQPPIYGPFDGMIRKAGMTKVEVPLLYGDDGWRMDFEGLERAFQQGAKLLLMCSPHNPVGRVWHMDELQTLVDLCARYQVFIICDEIHADFELRGAKHIPILSVPGVQNTVMMISATKTFNLAALRHSTVLCPDADIREKIRESMSKAMVDVNLFGRIATRAAYETGAEWLDALNEYLSDGRDIFYEGLKKIPGLRPAKVEGTYLMWLDCSGLGLEGDALNNFFVKKCAVIPTEGTAFGTQGSAFVRLNFATTHENLREAVRRIGKAVGER